MANIVNFCLVFTIFAATVNFAYGRNLQVDVIGGTVEAKDTFTSDPYMSVTVCKEKAKTPVISRTNHPQWNWSHTYSNVKDSCRIKFHLYDSDIASDDTIGIVEMNSLAEFMRQGTAERTLPFGKKGKSNIKIRIRYV